MPTDLLRLPSRDRLERHVLCALQRYWPDRSELVAALPLRQRHSHPTLRLPLKLVVVKMPVWADPWSIDGALLVPQEVLSCDFSSGDVSWQDIDWFLAIFLLLEAWHERMWEQKFGPIHSYSYRLKGWDDRVWAHAWVNRIALFLREWAAQVNRASAESLFGVLPKAEILMTHDVDAVEKTLSIRLKQGVFLSLNSIRALFSGDLSASWRYGQKAIRMFCSQEDWCKFDELLAAEENAGITSIFHFYADTHPKSIKQWVFDPGYAPTAKKIMCLIRRLRDGQHQIGLHPGYESWANDEAIGRQKKQLEIVTNAPVTACRQHWLRFSWQDTWNAQESAGLRFDSTLMFNDRPGFRNASALSWTPWSQLHAAAYLLTAQPTILMDSHLYDYQQLDDVQRQRQICAWISECREVCGQMSVLWHPHTLAEDYGWGQGFYGLLNTIRQQSRDCL